VPDPELAGSFLLSKTARALTSFAHPKTLKFTIDDNNQNDQYAKLMHLMLSILSAN